MQEDQTPKTFRQKLAGKGYYIALVVCLLAVGISGYVFLTSPNEDAVETAAAVSAAASAAKPTAAAPSATRPGAEAAADAVDADVPVDADAAAEAAVEAATVVWPVSGSMINAFSQETLTYSDTMNDWRAHEGVDIAAALGTPVAAAEAGTVTAVYDDDLLGAVVVVSHEDGMSTLYGGLAEPVSVAVDDVLSAGQPLGTVGDTALGETAEEAHLHFAAYRDGTPVDPLTFLPKQAG